VVVAAGAQACGVVYEMDALCHSPPAPRAERDVVDTVPGFLSAAQCCGGTRRASAASVQRKKACWRTPIAVSPTHTAHLTTQAIALRNGRGTESQAG
jgi:hypothetical protein